LAAFVGSHLAAILPAKVLKRAFAAFLILVAGRILWPKASKPEASTPVSQPGQPPQPAPTGPPRRVGSGTWSESAGVYGVNFTTVDGHPLYELLKAPANVRFLNDSVFLEFDRVVLAFSIGL